MILLLDIGNTHLHAGLSDGRRILRHVDLPTSAIHQATGKRRVAGWVGREALRGVCLCSVVPRVTPGLIRWVRRTWGVAALELNARSVSGIGIDYPRPETIGADRLANAVAVAWHFGAPSVVIDFGTAVTFDVVDRNRNYVGGIIAPGLEVMTRYLHERTALLPEIRIRDTGAAIGRNTEQAMLIGAVHGYRGLIKELLARLRIALRCHRLPVVVTGGYAALMARHLPGRVAVRPLLTLEGLRLEWRARRGSGKPTR